MSDAGYYLDLYTKQKARAEKAEVALAAARRECEGLRTALTTIRDELNKPWLMGSEVNRVAVDCANAVLEADAALAAPAAGEEGETLMRALRDSATVSTHPPTSKP